MNWERTNLAREEGALVKLGLSCLETTFFFFNRQTVSLVTRSKRGILNSFFLSGDGIAIVKWTATYKNPLAVLDLLHKFKGA